MEEIVKPKPMDTSEILKLRQTKWGYYLYINKIPQKLKFKNGVLLNELTEKQLNFVSNYLYEINP